MADYLLLMRNQGNPMEGLSPQEMQGHLNQWMDWMGGLSADGRLKAGQPLQGTSVCVRKDIVTDGPYAEAKDVVGGYLIVSCASKEEAIAIAQGCPTLALGGLVEVREAAPNVLQ